MPTHWKKLTNPDYLGSYSLDPGQELTLTIRNVVRENVTGPDGRKEECTVVHFKEKQKPMILNVTNAKTIQSIYGTPYIEDWVNKKITIKSEKIKAFGDYVDALRIKKTVTLENLNPNHPKWNGAVEAVKNGTVNIESIKKSYELSTENQKLLEKTLEEAA